MRRFILLFLLIPLLCFADEFVLTDPEPLLTGDFPVYETTTDIPEGSVIDADRKVITVYKEDGTDRDGEQLDDFGRGKPRMCICTLAYCPDVPCNTCDCGDGKTYKSW